MVEEEGPESGRTLVSDAGYSVRVAMTADQARVSSQGWVSGISVVTEADQARWQVNVTDEEVAKIQLLSLMLADEHTTVTEFGCKKYKLEEIFVSIVEGARPELVKGGENVQG
jgi:ABC-type uncharacterized transport system ATPase subunit